MRRIAVAALLCAALMLCAWACAEGNDLDAQVWMDPDDVYEYYFHAIRQCRLVDGDVTPCERVFAEVSGRTPCPVCWPEGAGADGAAGVLCFERGGTLVIRIPDAYMAERVRDAGEPAAVPEALLRENENPRDDIARLIHGADYCAWVEAAVSGTQQRFEVMIPDLDGERTEDLLMSRRHIGAAWVLVVRPDKGGQAAAKAGAYALPMAFYGADLRVTNYDAGPIVSQGEGSRRWSGEVPLSPKPSGGEIIYQNEDGYQTYVVADGGINVAVLRDAHDEAHDTTSGAFQFQCQTTPVEAYEDGGDAVFIFALTDGEVKALQDRMGYDLWTYPRDDGAGLAPVADHAAVTSVTLSGGTEAAMDQACYPIGTGFVSCTLTRPEGGIAYYSNVLPVEQLRDGQWKQKGTVEAYADGDPERAHAGYFCDHVSLVAPLEEIGALEPGLYRLDLGESCPGAGDDGYHLEFSVSADASAAIMPQRREFGVEELIIMPDTPPHADAAGYNSCLDNTRVSEGARATRLLAGDTVFELRGVDESWGWGIHSAYNLFAYPEGSPEQARQILANFDYGQVTMFDLGDGLLLTSDAGSLFRCDYSGANLREVYHESENRYLNDVIPVGDGVYMVYATGVWYAALDDFVPRQVYVAHRRLLNSMNGMGGGGCAVYAEGQLVVAEETGEGVCGLVALDALHPNADGTLPANWLTLDYDEGSGENGLGCIVLNGRLYCWSGDQRAMISMKLDGTDRQEVSRERYWFHSVTHDGCVLALYGTEQGLIGDVRTGAALFFPPDPANPTFDPDHSAKREIDGDAFDFVLGNYWYHRNGDGSETRQPLQAIRPE